MESLADFHIRYDPEANVALLSFTESSSSGGTALELEDGSGLAGLVRLGADGEFDRLELLGANRVMPQFIPRLHAPPQGTRDYHRGTVRVPMTVADNRSSVRFDLDVASAAGSEYEISVMARESSLVVAALRFADSGVLRALKLFSSGNLLRNCPLPGVNG